MPKTKNETSILDNIGVDYARYSSHAQKDASIEQQVAACRQKAKDLDITLIESYEDRAISGKTDKRPSFQRMMKDAEKGKFQYVIAWKSNRMGRNMLEAMMNEAKLNSYGIRVLYVEEDFDDTAAGRFALRSMMNVNQFYSENMAEDVMRGMIDNAKNCKVTNGHLPFGYKADKDLKYIIDAPKDEIVREIYNRVANGEAFVDICNSLNARGIKTSRGNEWGRSSLNSIIKNERYRGVYIYGDVQIKDGVPRIVSDELFFKVQEVLKMKKNAQGRHRVFGDYLLTGKLYCGKCKSPMTGYSGTSSTGTLHHYYVCQKRRVEKTCDKANVQRDTIEIAVAQAIKDYALQDDVIEWIADSTVAYNKKCEEGAHISILQDQLSDTQKSIKNIMTAIEQGIITDTTKDRLLALEAEQSEIAAKISAAKADIITISKEDMISGLEIFRNGNVKEPKYRAKLFDTFLVAVYLYDSELKIVFSFTGNKNTIEIPFAVSDAENTNIDKLCDCSFKLASGVPCRNGICSVPVFVVYMTITTRQMGGYGLFIHFKDIGSLPFQFPIHHREGKERQK